MSTPLTRTFRPLRSVHLAVALFLWPTASALAAGPPTILNHQGRIAVAGSNYDDTGYFKFAFVDGAGTTTLLTTHVI